MNQLRQITFEMQQLPFQAFELELCEVKPAYSSLSGVTWSPVANTLVRDITSNKRLVAKVKDFSLANLFDFLTSS